MLDRNHKQRRHTETAKFMNEDDEASHSPASKQRRLASNDRRRRTSTNITSKRIQLPIQNVEQTVNETLLFFLKRTNQLSKLLY